MNEREFGQHLKGLEVILVEDSREDSYITIRALEQIGCTMPVRIFDSGEQVYGYLTQSESDLEHKLQMGKKARPAIILLDLNLPDISGKDLLTKMHEHPECCRIPVIILSTSRNLDDVNVCYGLGANSYIHKPLDFDEFVSSLKVAMQYWLSVALIPQEVKHAKH